MTSYVTRVITTAVMAQALMNSATGLFPYPDTGEVFNIFNTRPAYAAEAAAIKYTCAMHPQIISDSPGKCPICGMDLVPMAGGHNHDLNNAPVEHPGAAPVVEINPETIQKMGVRIENVAKEKIGQGIRATGIVMENERTRHDLYSQVEGRIGDLKYGAIGDPVKKGDVFYTLYSPDLISLQNDYLAARKAGLKDMVSASRERMKQLGVDDRVLAELNKKGTIFEKVPFYVPADGVLAKMEMHNGHYMKVGDELARIQDLSTVWVEAAVAENAIGSIHAGDAATVTSDARTYDAKVDYIYPTINAESRTGKVRLLVDNKDGEQRPAAYVTVNFAGAVAPEQLTLPSEAILMSGDGKHVIMALGDGKFQARNVTTGSVTNGRTEILSGLREGEPVAVSAQFLIDSESSLRESLHKMTGGEHAGH